RLLITAVASTHPGAPATPHDLVVDTEDDASVGDLAQALGQRLRAAAPAPAAAPTLRLVGAEERAAPDPDPEGTAYPGVPDGPAPELYLGGERLDPGQPLADSPVRHGSLLGV